ncbi:MAG: DNA repair protein RecO [Gammaproteobacteria bacterium]|nr:DNA repair protein RecO [Gammaproteobacteria bacterium]
MAQITLQPGYVLHARAYRDSSVLVELLTRDYGRIGAVARGAKRVRSPFQGLLQPFNPLLLSWTGAGDLVSLRCAESAGQVVGLSGFALISGLYLNELSTRLLQRFDPHPELFAHYAEALDNLRQCGGDKSAALERVLRLFEKHLLDALGYGLTLDCEAETARPVEADGMYDYHLEHGPVPAVHDERNNQYPSRRIVAGLSGQTLLSLGAGELTEARSLRESKRLMRATLGLYLGDKPLYSRKLFAPPESSSVP